MNIMESRAYDIILTVNSRTGGKYQRNIDVIKETEYRIKPRWEITPQPNTTTTWGRRNVALYWGWNALTPKTQSGIVIHESVHSLQAGNRIKPLWWAFYLANMKRLEEEAYNFQQQFLTLV